MSRRLWCPVQTYILVILSVLPHSSPTSDIVSFPSKSHKLPRHTDEYKDTLTWVVEFKIDKDTLLSITEVESDCGLVLIHGFDHLLDKFLLVYNLTEKLDRHVEVSHIGQYLTIQDSAEGRFDQHKVRRDVEICLDKHDHVAWYSRQRVRSRSKRVWPQGSHDSVGGDYAGINFSDQYFSQQWHLVNKVNRNMDINVTGVWERNVTGRGVTVAIVDDGLEWTNQDIRDNYCKEGSWDLNDHDADPTPSNKKDSNHHGTRCAGEIAAVKNSYCAVGVAYRANISGIKVLDGPMTDSLEAEAFNKNLQMNDIYSCSWGPDDDGKTVDGPHIMALTAMRYGIDFGRGGYGSIYVVASGNGGRKSDNCNYDGYANSIYTVTIGAVDETGHMPFYAEECASMLAVTYSSGTSNLRSIATTDWTQRGASGCTVSHTGTSAAAPIAAGMIALMLQVRPCLTWRDVQYLIAMTAQKVDIDEAHWQRNGAGLYHSHKHGFGLMRAWRLVNAAKVWETVPWMTSYLYDSGDLNMQITKGQHNPLKLKYEVTESRIHGYDLFTLEQVLVTVTIDHPCRGQLGVVLICPSGTRSVIGSPRSLDRSTKGFDGWTFNTVRCWGESPIGNWTLIIRDIDQMKYGPGFLKNWKLKLYGTPLTPEQFQIRKRRIEESMSGQYLNDSFNLPCPEPPVTAKPDENMSQKTLKFIVLTGCFCLLVALYETFEYAACYREEKKAERSRMMEELESRMSSQNASGVTMETDSIAQDTHRYLNTSDGRGEYIQLRDMSSADADLAGNSTKSNSEENIYQASSASDVIGHDTSSTQVIAHVQSDHSNRSVINVNESFTSPGENRNPLPPSRHSIYDNLVSNVTQGANSDQPSVPNGALFMSRDFRSTLSSLDDDDDEKRTLLSSSSK